MLFTMMYSNYKGNKPIIWYGRPSRVEFPAIRALSPTAKKKGLQQNLWVKTGLA